MKQYRFLVPTVDNDGQPFAAADFAWLQDELVVRFGGWSCDGVVEGAWRAEDGAVYSDRSRRYVVVSDAERAEVFGFLAEVRDRFRRCWSRLTP